MIIAISGKGGVGKTMVSSLLVDLAADSGKYDILAVDSDPDSNLPEALGQDVELTVGDIRERLLDTRGQLPPEVSWKDRLEYDVMGALVETDKYDLLSMGRPEGAGCYCAANHVLRGIVDTIAKNYDIVIIDTEAGLEHLSRRTTQNVDTMLVVTDTSKRGMTTAHRIKELAEHLQIKFKNIYVIINRVKTGQMPQVEEYAKEVGLDILGTIPEDDKISEFDLKGRPLVELPEDSLALGAVKEIADKLSLR